jgi:hypothetical protein
MPDLCSLTSDMSSPVDPGLPGDYSLRISPTTVDKLGVKLYDKISAVVAELVANAYDADAEHVTVRLPLGTQLVTKDKTTKAVTEPDPPWSIEVTDDGHGMTPGEARRFFLNVGLDRRTDPSQGATSREKHRLVLGRKGIGKLAPFGVCRVIEVQSSGGEATADGYYTTHFFLEYDAIMAAGKVDAQGAETDDRVPLRAGANDGKHLPTRGTTIRLTSFDAKRVPDVATFKRQLERRFALAASDFAVTVHDTRTSEPDFQLEPFKVPIVPSTEIPLAGRPVQLEDGTTLPVNGGNRDGDRVLSGRGDGWCAHLRPRQDHRHDARLRAASRVHGRAHGALLSRRRGPRRLA